MNKKGFTLVEILAVIVILGLVMVIVGTKGFGAFDNTKNKITELNKEAIVESANLLILDIENCDDDFDNGSAWLNALLDGEEKTCDNLKESLKNDNACIETTVKFLKDNEYVTGSGINEISDDTKFKICKSGNKLVLKDEYGNSLTKETLANKNPYIDDKDSLAFKVIDNAIENKNSSIENSAIYSETPITNIGNESANETVSEYIEINTRDDRYWFVEASYSGGTWTTCNNDSIGKSAYLRSTDNSITEGNYKIIKCDGEFAVFQIPTKYDYESTLSSAQDDLGTSYYYRGVVEDNYLNFSGMCWRIVRIEGDGSIKIILEDQDQQCDSKDGTGQLNMDGNWNISTANYGYVNETKIIKNNTRKVKKEISFANYENGDMDSLKNKLENWLNIEIDDKGKLKKDEWCIGNITDLYNSNGVKYNKSKDNLIYDRVNYRFDTTRRLYDLEDKVATLKCSDSNYIKYESYIGTLSIDEVIFSGYSVKKGISYLINDYLENNNLKWWTLSPSMLSVSNSSEMVWYAGNTRVTSISCKSKTLSVRPAVTLNKDVTIMGNGTKESPYTVVS